MFMALVATTTFLTGGICMASWSRVEPLSKTTDWLSVIRRAAICAIRRLASKLRCMRSSKAAVGESAGHGDRAAVGLDQLVPATPEVRGPTGW